MSDQGQIAKSNLWRHRLDKDPDFGLFEPTLKNFLSQNLQFSEKQSRDFIDNFMDEVVHKESNGEPFRNIIEEIVNVLKKCIQSSNNNNFATYIKRNFSKNLIEMVENNKSMLAFDLGDEDDEFNMMRQFSSGGQNNEDSQNEQKTESFRISRRNLQENQSEEESEDEDESEERHFKRRLRRRSSSQSNGNKVKRSRSRSLDHENKRGQQNEKKRVGGKKDQADYDPLNPQQSNNFNATQPTNKPAQFLNVQQQITPSQQQQIYEAQRNAWALHLRNNPLLLQQYQSQILAMQQQQQQNQNQGVIQGSFPAMQNPALLAQIYSLTQQLQPVPVQANSQQQQQINTHNDMNMQRTSSNSSQNQQQQHQNQQKKNQSPQVQQNLPPSKLEARKYSILVKNIPEELNNIGDLNSYFQKFGYIQNINVDLQKKSALIKFKQIESAAKAGASTDPIFDNPKIKILYTIIEPQAIEDPISPEKKREEALANQNYSKFPPTNKTYESEDLAKKRKLEELKKDISTKRRALMEKHNDEIKAQMKNLNQEGLDDQQRKEIEQRIEEAKVKLNILLKEENAEKMKEKEEKKQQHFQFQKKKEEQSKPVELILFDIGAKQQFDSLIKALRKYGRVTDFKFTNEGKTQALVKYMNQTASYLLDSLAQEGICGGDKDLAFKVRQKEDQQSAVQLQEQSSAVAGAHEEHKQQHQIQ